MESRVKEIDYLKCIFITLMIIFHLVYIGDKYPYAKQIVYTFHMSAFLIISGYLANNRKDARSFLRKFLWIFIPYACMEAAYTVMSHFLPVRENVDAITPAILLDKIFLHPMGPYWYLHTLILCSLIYYVTFRYVRLSVVSRLIVAGVCLFAVSYWGGLMNFSNVLYFLIGTAVSQSGLRFTQVFRGTPLAIVPFVILCCFPTNLDRGTLAGVAITWLSISLPLAAYGYLPARAKRLFLLYRAQYAGHTSFLAHLHDSVQDVSARIRLRPYGDVVPCRCHRLHSRRLHGYGVGYGQDARFQILLREEDYIVLNGFPILRNTFYVT